MNYTMSNGVISPKSALLGCNATCISSMAIWKCLPLSHRPCLLSVPWEVQESQPWTYAQLPLWSLRVLYQILRVSLAVGLRPKFQTFWQVLSPACREWTRSFQLVPVVSLKWKEVSTPGVSTQHCLQCSQGKPGLVYSCVLLLDGKTSADSFAWRQLGMLWRTKKSGDRSQTHKSYLTRTCTA